MLNILMRCSRRHGSCGPRREKPPTQWHSPKSPALLLLLLVVVLRWSRSSSSENDGELVTHLSLTPRHVKLSAHFSHSGAATGTYGANVGPSTGSIMSEFLNKSAMPRWSPYVLAKFSEVGSTHPWESSVSSDPLPLVKLHAKTR